MHYLGECYRACGPCLLAVVLAALAVAVARRRRDTVVALLALCPAGAALNYLSPLHDARHLLPLVPVMALLASMVLYEELRARPRLVAAIEAGLLALTLLSVARMQDIRHRYDPYGFLISAYRAAPSLVPEDATILSLYTYYYTRREATWPLAWGRASRLVELFRVKDPDRFLAVARENEIAYVLAQRWPGPDEFLDSNYNRSFGDCVSELILQSKVRMVWMNDGVAIVAMNP